MNAFSQICELISWLSFAAFVIYLAFWARAWNRNRELDFSSFVQRWEIVQGVVIALGLAIAII